MPDTRVIARGDVLVLDEALDEALFSTCCQAIDGLTARLVPHESFGGRVAFSRFHGYEAPDSVLYAALAGVLFREDTLRHANRCAGDHDSEHAHVTRTVRAHGDFE